MDYLEQLQSVWKAVRGHYSLGSCVSERGLQALLYAELRLAFPEAKIIVEPQWRNAAGAYIPDIVIARDDLITDVFELKFTPHHYAKIGRDIQKLILYGTAFEDYAASLKPSSGKSNPGLKASENLRRHFVVIARGDAAAVWVESVLARVPELRDHLSSFYHWFGRIAPDDRQPQEWGVASGRPQVSVPVDKQDLEERVVCALCGTDGDLIMGRTGVACRRCIAEAITSVLVAKTSEYSRLTGGGRCLLCGDFAVQKGEYAAVRDPYAICAECMKDALDDAGQDSFLVAAF